MRTDAVDTFPTIEAKNASHPDAGRLRVAIFSDALPERNGAGAYYEDLAAQLGPRLGALQLFRPVVKKRLLRFALPLPGDPTQKLITPNLLRIHRQFRALRPHLVVAVTPGPFGLLGFQYARRSGCGFLTGFHTHFEGLCELYGNSLVFRAAQRYLEAVNGLLCRNSDAVLVNNAGLRQTVERLGARRVEVVGTPLAQAFLDTPPVPRSGPLRQVLFAGRLAPEKNIPAIIEAARALPQVRFVLAGDGPLRARLEAAARDHANLVLTGWLDRTVLSDEMDAADLLILPSHMETFGTVALEAMARGRPALVAEAAGIHYWPTLQPALLTLGDGQSLAEALRGIPPNALARKGAAARAAAESLNARNLDQWLELVQRYGRDPTR